MTIELDNLFGQCLPAGKPIETLEFVHKPNSLQEFGDEQFEGLRKYLESAESLAIPRTLHEQIVILWVMGATGEIYVAFEELIDATTGQYLMPYFRSNPVTSLLKDEINGGRIGRLGHPSLLSGDRLARIGGEIRFRPTDDDGFLWKINRGSGRYGIRPHQTDAHLVAVHSLFVTKGLHIGIE
ncbi:hypothetical protein [Neorhizobium vignae]|uniref:hypothetical protein n=1 Tax=Neorhizobium vignae TaxID=690585 RepID=UPI000563A0C1|nr:hypothetical protein [Neorhizobium vignae]